MYHPADVVIMERTIYKMAKKVRSASPFHNEDAGQKL